MKLLESSLSFFVWQPQHLQIDLPSTMFSGAGKGQNRQSRGRAIRVDVLAWEHCPWLDIYVQGHCHGAIFWKRFDNNVQ